MFGIGANRITIVPIIQFEIFVTLNINSNLGYL